MIILRTLPKFEACISLMIGMYNSKIIKFNEPVTTKNDFKRIYKVS